MIFKEKTKQEIVDDLNWKLWGEDGNLNNSSAFTYKSATVWESISYHDINLGLEIEIWNSENNDLEYREETDDYESLEDYILKAFSLITAKMFKVDNHLNNRENEQ